MSKGNGTKENLFIHFNSLITISSISETNINKFSKYLIRIENLEQTLIFKKCLVPLSDFSDLKESLFYIREKDDEDYNKEIENKNNNTNNEESLENKRINYNKPFILQHMISKKYISIENLQGTKNYSLKLTSNKSQAVPFELKRIHETRNSQEYLTFKQSFYLSIYIKEKDQSYFINFNSYSQRTPEYDIDSLLIGQNNFYVSNENITSNKDNQININNINDESKEEDLDNGYAKFCENFSEISIEKKMNCKYIFLNQSWYIKDQDKLFSSHIVNIIFVVNSNLYKDSPKNNLITEKEELLMLSAEYIDNINTEEINDIYQGPIDTNEFIKKRKTDNYFYDDNKGLIGLQTNKKKLENQVRVKLIPYEEDFYKHVINNSFWVLEEELTEQKEKLKKSPLKPGAQIKIKNALLGLYLKVKKKGNEIKIEELEQKIDENNPNQNIDNTTKNSDNGDGAEYEFELVDGETLIKNNFVFSNFKIFHYSIDKNVEYMSYKGKYALSNFFKDEQEEFKNFDFDEINKYFQPLSINFDSEKKYYLLQKNENEFMIEIKKVDIFEANHVIYMSKLIQNFNFYLEKCIKNEIRVDNAIRVIALNLSFFINYLINVEYIFRDDNYDINIPIEQRQVILENYGVLKSIRKIAIYLLPIIKDMKLKNKNIYQIRKSSDIRINNNNSRSLKSSLINNNNILNSNKYRIDTLNEQINTNKVSMGNIQNLITICLEFLKLLSNNNEEIKEKIFLDLDIILELAENVFVLDKSNLLDLIFKLIKDSEALQEYITGGKLNLMFTIKNSKHYTKYAEKESQNKLIRDDKILMYIETSNNYLYYYKKLLKLNKVRHKRVRMKQLIEDHMKKIENDYKYKYNYKYNLIKHINRVKSILNSIEEPLLKRLEIEDKKEKTNINKSKIRKEPFTDKKSSENINDIGKQKNENIKPLNEMENEEGKEEGEIKTLDLNSISENDESKKQNINNKNYNGKKGKDEKINNYKEDCISIENNEEYNSNSLINNLSQRDTTINKRTKAVESFKIIKSFLGFFENFNIKDILFIQEECIREFFNSFNVSENLKNELDFIVGGKNKSIHLIDGIKLDPDSELGQLIPFNLFNKFFPKFLNTRNINFNNNLNSFKYNIDEDSENDIYNNNLDIIDEKPDYIEENNEIQFNNKNNNKTKVFDESKNFALRSISHNIQLDLHFNNNSNLNKNISNKKARRSITNQPSIRNKILYNNIFDNHLPDEINDKDLDKKMYLLNKYLCILYSTYQFCINEFYECLLTILNILNNYFINYGEFCDMNIFEKNLKKIRENLISKISFIGNEVLNNLYSSAREKPSLLKGVFDFDNFLVSNKENENYKHNNFNEYIDLVEFSDYKNTKSFSQKMKINKGDNKRLKVLIPEEHILMKFLFSFCKKYDKIVYIIDKFNYFRSINELINNIQGNKITSPLKYSDTLTSNEIISIINNKNDQHKNDKLYNDEKNTNYVLEFVNIIHKLYEKRNRILASYIDINNYKQDLSSLLKNQKDKILKHIKPFSNVINKRFEIIIGLMMNYEIDYIFGKLIYLGANKNSIYSENNILKNFKNVQNNFENIKNEIKKIKIDYDRRGDNCIKIIKDEGNNIINKISFNDSNFNKEHFKQMNNCLAKMNNSFLNFLNMNSNGIARLKNMPKLNRILYKENDFFYQKIGFEKIMQSLIEAIDYFYDFNRNPLIKLNFCQEILRIFLEIQNIYKNFKETIPKYFELYYKMIMSSLHTITLYQDNLTGQEEEKYFLKICFYSCESFMIVIFNSEKNFNDLSTFMIDIFKKLLKIYFHLINPKNRIIFQILYTYYLLRVLLFISKEKFYDEFSYNSFFQKVYPMEQMHEKILSCMKELETKEDDEDESSEEKEITEESNSSNEIKKTKSKRKDTLNINNNNNKYFQKNLENNNEEEIIWESEEEKEKFCFYLNYLTIYLLYLHDRNSMKKIKENKNNENSLNIVEYNYKNLFQKLEKLLGNYEVLNSQNEQIQDLNYLKLKTFNSNQISKKLKIDLRESTLNTQKFEKIKNSKNNFQFESILIESIILYKYRLKNQIIEIPVKNRNSKKQEEDIVSNEGSEDKTSSLSGKLVKIRNNEMITFYYYDNEFIDLILMEKICNDINLKENLDFYCTERNFIKKGDLMSVLLNMKEECKLIMSYYKGEYRILHDQYIQNDMEQFIMLLRTRFTNKDFNRIYSMKKFLYKKMNEIYSDDLYFGTDISYDKKMLSFVEQFKLIEKLYYINNPVYKNFSIFSFFTSLIYLETRYPKKTCVLYYIIGFKLLSQRCKQIELEETPVPKYNENAHIMNQRKAKIETTSLSYTNAHNIEEKYYELDKMIEGLIQLFSIKNNRNVIQDDEDFFLMIGSLIEFLKVLKRKKQYLVKRGPKITKLFTVLDFVFDHLFHDFEKIINFMKSAENQKMKDKFRKKETNLKIIIIFISNILSLQKESDNNLLTQNITEFIQNLTGQIIKLIKILIEIGKEDSMKTCDMLLDFIYFFIEGLNKNNLNSLFLYGYYNLLTFIITQIDYYKIFLNNINRINLHNIIDNYAKIEEKIIKIFFIYYNVAYNSTNNIIEYKKMMDWYENNHMAIKIKLKKLYHFSKVEMEKRSFNIDKALIYKKKKDDYSEKELLLRAGILNKSEIDKISFDERLNKMLDEDNRNEIAYNDMNNDLMNDEQNAYYNDLYQNLGNNSYLYNESSNITHKNTYCLIKFDLILIYYSLNLYYKDIINEEYFEVVSPTDSFFTDLWQFLIDFVFFVKDIIFSIPQLFIYLYRSVKEKAKSKVDLLQELNTIDEDIQNIDDKDMLLDLSSQIKCVEILINSILYKVYFPLINKAKKIEEKPDYYLYVGNEDLPYYISYIIRNYDKIQISVTKNDYYDKLAKIPMLNLIFKNIKLLGIFLMIIGIISNLLILLSYSDFTNNTECDCGDNCQPEDRRLYCPRFLFNSNRSYITINRTLRVFGILQLIFQAMVFFDYIIRNFSINYALSKRNYIINKARNTKQKRNIKIKFFEHVKIILITILHMFTFQLIYYILYIIFILLGLLNHPFFYAFSLFELVNRVEVMLSVLKAIYVPGLYLLVNLLMLIMLEYFFSLFSISIFTSHFPNIKDSKNFLQTYMRMLDQTFKQDGGIGTYLDQSLDPDYEQYTPKAYAGGRYWFDLIFYILIILIIFQIFISVIVDYFMENRKNREDFTKKSNTECLICGLKREQLEKIYSNIKDGFNKHRVYCHHIMNYINYLFYVQSLSYRDPIIEEGIWKYHLDNNNIYLNVKTCFQMKERKILKIINANKDNEEKA